MSFRNPKPDKKQSEKDVEEIAYEDKQDAEPSDGSAVNHMGFRVAIQ